MEQTRLERREVPWFEMAALLDAAGIELLHTHRDGIVRVQDEVAGIKAVLPGTCRWWIRDLSMVDTARARRLSLNPVFGCASTSAAW